MLINPLHVEGLDVTGFRGFSYLRIDGFNKVNLIVGKNNVGKTSVLEALRLVLLEGDRQKIVDILTSREEYSFRRYGNTNAREEAPLAFEALFFDRPEIERGSASFEILARRVVGSSHLLVSSTWLTRTPIGDDGISRYVESDDLFGPTGDGVQGLAIDFNDRRTLTPFSAMSRTRLQRIPSAPTEIPVTYLPSSGLTNAELGRVWDGVALTEDEDEVLDGLRIISPAIEKLVLVQNPVRPDRMMMAKLKGFYDPVPFRSLGEGVNHLLGVFLSIVRSKGGVVLIDEVENGVHYSVQKALWRLIFKQARRWNVQVFATTHSWDCVGGFEEAAILEHEDDSVLVRIENRDGEIRPVMFSAREVSIAKDEDIEVR